MSRIVWEIHGITDRGARWLYEQARHPSANNDINMVDADPG